MTQHTLFRWLLVGLPVGLGLSVVVSIYLYYHPLDFSTSGRTDPAALMRKSPAAADLAAYLRVLETDLATRALREPVGLTRTTKWLESSLGVSNMGYAVQNLATSDGPQAERDIYVELPGRSEPGNVLLVSTRYDTDAELSDSNLSVATLLTLANTFVGTPQKRTLVFAWSYGATGADRLRQSLVASGRTIFGSIDLHVEKGGTGIEFNVLLAPRRAGPWGESLNSALTARLPAGWPKVTAALPEAATDANNGNSAQVVTLSFTAPASGRQEACVELARSLEGTLQVLANQ